MRSKIVTLNELIDLADRARRSGGGLEAHRIHMLCQDAANHGQITYDDVGGVFKHLMIHAGSILPRSRGRFLVCPECEAVLDVPTDHTPPPTA